LQVFAAVDDPACQGLSWNIDAVATEYFFEAMQRQTVDLFGGQQRRQHAGTGHAPFNLLRWLISGDRRGFTATAGVDLADVFDHADLHRYDFQLLACFFADGMLAAAASTSQLVLGQFVDDIDTGKSACRGLCLPRRLFGATTSSSAYSAAGSATLSASLKRANYESLGSTVCSDFRAKRR
jgi:hypothetical protein